MATSAQSVGGGPRCPLLLAALGYAAGILLAQYCWRPRLWWLVAAGACLTGALAFAARAWAQAGVREWPRAEAGAAMGPAGLEPGATSCRGAFRCAMSCRSAFRWGARWRGWAALGCAVACAVALGALGYDARWATEPDDSGWESLTSGDKLVVTGYVVKDGLLRGSGASRRQSVDVQIEAVELDASGDHFVGPTGDRVIGPSGDRVIDAAGHSKRAGSNHRRRSRVRRRIDPCTVNAAWPAELLAASGMAGCGEKHTREPASERELAGSGGTDESPLRRRARTAKTLRSAQGDKAGLSSLTVGENGEAGDDKSGVRLTQVPQGIIRISIYGKSAENEDERADASVALPSVFTYGQRLRFPVKLRPPRNFGNPGSLDYAGYLRGQGIYALGSVRADRIELVGSGSHWGGGSLWGLWRSRVRRSVIGKVHALWPAEQAGLLDAMLIGERSFIGRETSTAFQRTGIYHIMVVSGMNVGILAFVVFWTLRRLRCGEVVATAVTILLSCGYAYLAESGAPIVRSVVMLAIYLCTRLLYRERAMLNALGAAALVLMVADPRAVTDASFQLTFLSVLAICGIAVPLIERTSQRYRTALRWLSSTDYDMSLEPRLAQFRIDLRTLAGRLARALPRLPRRLYRILGRSWRTRAAQSVMTRTLTLAASAYELLVVSFTTQVALALPMAWYFHRATVAGLPANLIAVPLTGLLMPASVAAVALSYVWMPLARVPAWVTSWSVNGINWTVNVLGGIRAADLRVAGPALGIAVAASVAFAAAVLLARKRRTLAISGLAALCAAAAWIALVPPNPRIERGRLEVTAVDVGQAESFLVVTPDGKTLLVDAAGSLGPWQSEFDFGEDVIAPYLWSRGITRLDAVVITHAHSDHYGGMTSITTIFRPQELWVGTNAPDRGFDALVKWAEQQGTKIVRRSGGETFDFGGARVRVLAPAQSWETAKKPRNDDSLVLWVGFGETSALLEADAEKASERQMLGSAIKSDLLKVAHNGSNTSSTPEFLSEVQPSYAVISVGARNSFGHPRPEVLERLAAMHVRTYRTDLLGAVTFLLDGKNVTARLPMMENR